VVVGNLDQTEVEVMAVVARKVMKMDILDALHVVHHSKKLNVLKVLKTGFE
jgi:hypothetical protein